MSFRTNAAFLSLLLVLTPAGAAEPVGAAAFVGTWRGKCEASGTSAYVELDIREEKNGTFVGTWANLPVRGERLGKETLYFEAVTKEKTYRLVGSIDDGRLVVNYSVAPIDGGTKSYGAGTLDLVGSDRSAAEWALRLLEDPEYKDGGILVVTPDGKEVTLRKSAGLPAGPFTVRRVDLWGNGKVTDEGMKALANVKGLQSFGCYGAPITDVGLQQLERSTEMKVLDIANTKITGEGLKYVRGMKGLDTLFLGGTGTTDAGLAQIKNLKHLRILGLNDTAITNEGLEHLRELAELRELNVERTKVTAAGVERLQKALPDCKIVR